MPDTTSSRDRDHARFTRMLTHSEGLAAQLDEYETKDFDLISTEEIKIRLRHAAQQLRLLGKALVIEIDDDRALTDRWEEIVPLYIQRHSV